MREENTEREGAEVENIADYRLMRFLGEGNHGEFYLAEAPARLHLGVDQLVVKVISGSSSDDNFRRATRELRLFASVNSPYIVTVFDAGQVGSDLFYSMEYFPLGSLGAAASRMDRSEVLHALADAAHAAEALHEVGIVHRDIKPDNIMLSDHRSKLADLGMAQLLTPGLTVTGMGSIGSIEFIDPGIIQGEQPSRASDIWSLGVAAHRALTGTGLYGVLPAGDPILALRRVVRSTPTLDSSLSTDEADLIRACLAPDPTDRPATAHFVAKGLESLIDQ
jgi:serine/threonine protein kinase